MHLGGAILLQALIFYWGSPILETLVLLTCLVWKSVRSTNKRILRLLPLVWIEIICCGGIMLFLSLSFLSTNLWKINWNRNFTLWSGWNRLNFTLNIRSVECSLWNDLLIVLKGLILLRSRLLFIRIVRLVYFVFGQQTNRSLSHRILQTSPVGIVFRRVITLRNFWKGFLLLILSCWMTVRFFDRCNRVRTLCRK